MIRIIRVICEICGLNPSDIFFFDLFFYGSLTGNSVKVGSGPAAVIGDEDRNSCHCPAKSGGKARLYLTGQTADSVSIGTGLWDSLGRSSPTARSFYVCHSQGNYKENGFTIAAFHDPDLKERS